MSSDAITAVKHHPDIKRPDFLIMMVLADFADPDGLCWPSISSLAAMCRCSTRNIKVKIASLVERKLVIRKDRWTENGRQTSNYYQINLRPIAREESLNGKMAFFGMGEFAEDDEEFERDGGGNNNSPSLGGGRGTKSSPPGGKHSSYLELPKELPLVHKTDVLCLCENSQTNPTSSPLGTNGSKAEWWKAKTGKRLREDFKLPRNWGLWACELGFAKDDVRFEADQFRDYWLAESGAKARKRDWKRTWQRWMREAHKRRARRAPHGARPDGTSGVLDELRRQEQA